MKRKQIELKRIDIEKLLTILDKEFLSRPIQNFDKYRNIIFNIYILRLI